MNSKILVLDWVVRGVVREQFTFTSFPCRMPSSSPTLELQLQRVASAVQLHFAELPNRFAYVYRRHQGQAWECIAHRACSPCLDRKPLPSNTHVEYVVCYCDANGTITATTSVAHAYPNVLSPNSSRAHLRS